MNSLIFTKELSEEFIHFFEYTPPARLSSNLRNLLLTYLTEHKDGHPFNIEDLLVDLTALFNLLDVAQQQLANPTK